MSYSYTNPPASPENMLDDIVPVQLRLASTGQRLANYLVDRLVFGVFWQLVQSFLAAPIEFITGNYKTSGLWLFFLGTWLVSGVIDILFLTAFEFLSGGKTPGKWATGTRAVMEDGSRLTLKAALIRSICRAIPFEPFSTLGSPPHPWHDSLSKTYVIDERKSTLPVAQA